MSQDGDRGSEGGGQALYDAEYLKWRNRQIRELDKDYERWRQQNHEKFSEEFPAWRKHQHHDPDEQDGDSQAPGA